MDTGTDSADIETFIARWEASGASERSNAPLFLTELCDLLRLPHPNPAGGDNENTIHEQGLVSVLLQLHDDLDRAVANAYTWPPNLPEEDILQRLVDLNHQRAQEEAQNQIRYLRPTYQNPQGPKPTQEQLITPEDTEDTEETPDSALRTPNSALPPLPWPPTLPEQIRAVRAALTDWPATQDRSEVAKLFKGVRKAKIEEILEILKELGA
jgi:hypothetical protein